MAAITVIIYSPWTFCKRLLGRPLLVRSMRSSPITHVCQVLLIATTLCVPIDALSCSLARTPPPKPTRDGKAVPIPEYPYAYRFSAEVVGETPVVANSPEGPKTIAALRVRVIESKTPKTTRGDEHQIHRTELRGPRCDAWPEDISLRDYPVGTRLQVSADSLSNAQVYRLE